MSERGHEVFTTEMAAEVLGRSSFDVRKRLHYLVRRRWLQRLEKGKYLIVPLSAGIEGHYAENELIIAAHLVSPYYISQPGQAGAKQEKAFLYPDFTNRPDQNLMT